jgi:hypothetical protein
VQSTDVVLNWWQLREAHADLYRSWSAVLSCHPHPCHPAHLPAASQRTVHPARISDSLQRAFQAWAVATTARTCLPDCVGGTRERSTLSRSDCATTTALFMHSLLVPSSMFNIAALFSADWG